MKPKIAWPSVGSTEYSLIPEGFILLDTNYFLTCSNHLNLLAFLNSSLIVWWINSEDTQLGTGGAWRHYKYNLEKLWIPYSYKGFEDEINRILSSHYYNDTESIDIINKKVFELYNLDEEEIRFIQSQYIQ